MADKFTYITVILQNIAVNGSYFIIPKFLR